MAKVPLIEHMHPITLEEEKGGGKWIHPITLEEEKGGGKWIHPITLEEEKGRQKMDTSHQLRGREGRG